MANVTFSHDTASGTHVGASDILGNVRVALSAFGSRLIRARMREADRYVAYHLLALDDATLAELGYDRAELKRKNPVPGTL